MKRKASRAPGYERPSKLTKESTTATVGQTLNSIHRKKSVKKPSLQPVKLPSFRKKDAQKRPSPYPTRSNTIGQKIAATSAWPKFPALIPPSRQKSSAKKKTPQQSSDKEVKAEEDVHGSLRRQSTVELKDSPPPSMPKSQSKRNSVQSSYSLKKGDTEILGSVDDKKSSAISKRNSKLSTSTSVSKTTSSKLSTKMPSKRKSTRSIKQ